MIIIYTMVHSVWKKLGFIVVSSNVATPRNVVYDGHNSLSRYANRTFSKPPVQELQCNQNQSVDPTPKNTCPFIISPSFCAHISTSC